MIKKNTSFLAKVGVGAVLAFVLAIGVSNMLAPQVKADTDTVTWNATFFNGKCSTNCIFTTTYQVDPFNLQLNYGSNNPPVPTGVNTNQYTDTVTGTQTFTQGGEYQLDVTHDNGLEILMDGVQVYYSADQAHTTFKLYNIPAGNHTMTYHHWQQGGDSFIRATWTYEAP